MSFNLAVILSETAHAAPDKPVAVFDGGQLTYRQLDQASDRVAANLAAAGIGPGDRVALQLPNIPQFLISYFGILKAGAVVVPLNVLLRAPEIAYHLEDSGALVLITWAGVLAEAVKGAEAAGIGAIFAVGHPAGSPGALPFERLLDGAAPAWEMATRQPTDTAVIVYTSGTTGQPKGAQLTHLQLYMNADIPGRLFDVQPDDIVITVLPLFHVFGLSSILDVCVRFGCTMSLIPRFTPAAVLAAIQRDRATIFEGVPTMFADLLSSPDLDRCDLSSLRVAISGGASIPAPVLDAFEARLGLVILEGYGMTETAATMTFNPSAAERRAYSVGKPIWGTQTQVWDDDGRPLPPGPEHVGEIVTRGLHVMKGYLNRPEATAEAFTGHWLHTGDLGYFDEDGFLFIVSRKKELIIRGGYNVYPSEIENVLHAHPAVAEAAVVGVPDERLGEEVMAVVIVRGTVELREHELVSWCRERLAAYKCPRVFQFRSELPKNALGKILKDELAQAGTTYAPHPQDHWTPSVRHKAATASETDRSNIMTTATEAKPPDALGRLEGRVALVTGGTRGIGAAISHRLAQEGAHIAAGYWRHHEAAEKFTEDMNAEYPGTITVHNGNIGEPEDCRRVVREVIEQHGRLDILVNNAGITIDKTVAKMGDEDWLRVVSINLSGAFFVAQAALEHMLVRGTGRIISVSSVIGETGNIGQANYAASKSGLFGLTKSLAREAVFMLNRSSRPAGDGPGLTVNGVTPGYIATDMLATIPDKVLERLRGQIPVGRLGKPEEIARVVAFLAADESSYITGQIWAVNGGLDM